MLAPLLIVSLLVFLFAILVFASGIVTSKEGIVLIIRINESTQGVEGLLRIILGYFKADCSIMLKRLIIIFDDTLNSENYRIIYRLSLSYPCIEVYYKHQFIVLVNYVKDNKIIDNMWYFDCVSDLTPYEVFQRVKQLIFVHTNAVSCG